VKKLFFTIFSKHLDTSARFLNHKLPAYHNTQHSTTILFRLWRSPALARLVRRLTSANATFFYTSWDEVNRLPNRWPDRNPTPGGTTGTTLGQPSFKNVFCVTVPKHI